MSTKNLDQIFHDSKSVKKSVSKVEREMHTLYNAILTSVDEIIEAMESDPQFAERMGNTILNNRAFRKKIMDALLEHLLEENKK